MVPGSKIHHYPGATSATNADLRHLERLEDGGWSEPDCVFTSALDAERASVLSRQPLSGRFEVYAQPFLKGDGKRQISHNGGGQPRCSKDGTELTLRGGGYDHRGGGHDEARFFVRLGEAAFSSPSLVEQWRHPAWDVSADGERFVLIEPVGDPLPAAIRGVQDWFEEFRDPEQD